MYSMATKKKPSASPDAVNPDHARIDGSQVRLQLRAAAFRFDGGDGIGVGGVLDQLERHRLAVFGVVGEVHVGHPAASQFADDLVLADLAAGRGDHSATSCSAV